MALRTAEEYKQGLRDGRKVFILGQPVADVTEDPYIKVGVETGAFDFLMGHNPEMQDIAAQAKLQDFTITRHWPRRFLLSWKRT